MLRRMYRIFQRYADQHLCIDAPGGALDGDRGRIDSIEMRENRVFIKGWTRTERVGVELDSLHGWTTPHLSKPGSDDKGFELDVPFRPGTLELLLEEGGVLKRLPLASFSATRIMLKRQLLWPRFFASVLRLMPQIIQWKRRGDLGAREHVKEGLGLVPSSQPGQLQERVFHGDHPEQEPLPFEAATIVLPVYNAPELTRECIRRVIKNSNFGWRMIVIDDASPDDGVWPMLTEICGECHEISLMQNEANMGFVQTVNKGFQIALERWPDCPVILLNSDALVPEGWLSRLLAPLQHADVASVTPFSNDAEIFTAPVICHRHDMARGLADALDDVAKRITLEPADIDAPTGVGFCMAMAPRFLKDTPSFDTVFGRGYGEETDWCQKTRAKGGRHVCALNLFVEHKGGESFGSAKKQQLLEKNLKVITRRYPSYDSEVQTFLREDPLNTARLALAMAWASLQQSGPVPVYIAHAMGGGAEIWLRGKIAEETSAGRSVAVLRVGQGARYLVELHCAHGATRGSCETSEQAVELFELLESRRVIYSCGVGDRDAITLPALIEEIAAGTHPIEVLFHDFFPISPSYTLLDSDGVFHGVPKAPYADKAHTLERPGGACASLGDWQEAWARVLTAAERVVVFSEDSKRHVTEAYPGAAAAIVVLPHSVRAHVEQIANVCEEPPVIGVLGNIGYHKGAGLLRQLSREFAKSGAAKIVVVGQLDPTYALDKRAGSVHGSYQMQDLPGIVQKYKITTWMIPSIWPETFSFTTHEALATGMPVICLDIGAQGEAVKRAQAAGAPAFLLAHETVDPSALAAQIDEYLQELVGKAKT